MTQKESKKSTTEKPEEAPAEEEIPEDSFEDVDDYFTSEIELSNEPTDDIERQRKVRRLLEDRLEQKRLREELDYFDIDDDPE